MRGKSALECLFFSIRLFNLAKSPPSRGLKAEETLMGARIFAVADSFDAITSDRPYRRASSFETGRETIGDGAGRLFDPQVVDVFLSIPTETWSTIARDRRQMAALPSRLPPGQRQSLA
jgi:hypothetical protein